MQYLLRRLACAALALALLGAGAQATPLQESFFIEVQALVIDGDPAAAEAQLVEALAQADAAPGEARLSGLQLLADIRRDLDDPKGAGDALSAAAAMLRKLEDAGSPRLSPLHAAAGRAYLEARDFRRALSETQAALEIDALYLPCDSATLGALHAQAAKALDGLGETDEADFQRLLAEDPEERCAEAGTARGVSGRAASEDGEFVEVDVHFATDRATTGDPRPESFYGSDRGILTYGVATVTIPRDHKPGQIELPSFLRFEWRANPRKHIVLAKIENSGRDAYFDGIRAEMEDDTGIPEVFVFIHGYNVSFSAAAKRAAQLAYDLNFDGLPVLFSWPSRARTGGYLADAAVVQLSGRRLMRFLDELSARSGAERIHIVAHSMGNRALTEALELLALSKNGEAPLFDQVIFAAPDVDADLFAEQLTTIAPIARRLTLYTSDADLALQASRRLHGDAPRAGQGGEITMVSDQIDSIDMTVIGDDMLKHSYFANDSSALTDILWLFWRNEPPASRCGMVQKEGERGAYWAYVAEECEGNVLLSALTLARRGGAEMLARLDARILEAEDAGDSEELAELQGIRKTLVEILEN